MDVKARSLTPELHPKLLDLSPREVGGIPGVAVKCVDIGRNTSERRQPTGLVLTLRDESVGSEPD